MSEKSPNIQRKQPYIGVILALLLLFYCLDFFFRIAPSVVVHPLIQQYHITALGMGGFASAFYLGYAIMQIPSGAILDRFRFTLAMAVAIVICVLTFIGFLLVSQYWAGYGLRLVIGAASAFSFVGVLTLARQYFDPKYFSFIAGIAIGAGTIAASGVQVLGAWAMNFWPWHAVLIVASLFGLVIAGLLLLPYFKLPKRQAMQSPREWSAFKSIMLQPILLTNAIVGGLFYLPTTIFASLWGVPFLEQDYGLTRIQAATGIMWLFIGWAIGAPIIGYWAERLKHYHRLMTVGALLGFAVSLIMIYGQWFSGVEVWILLLVFGVASSAQAGVWKVFHEHAPQQMIGLGVAVTNMIIMLAGVIFHVVVGWLLTLGVFNRANGSINYHLGLVIIPISFFVVALLAFTLRRR